MAAKDGLTFVPETCPACGRIQEVQSGRDGGSVYIGRFWRMFETRNERGIKALRTTLALAAVVGLSLFFYGCSGAQTSPPPSSGDGPESTSGGPTTTANAGGETTAEETTGANEAQNNASSGDAGQANGDRESNVSGEAGVAMVPGGKEGRVTVGVEGDEGVRFAGFCAVNGERERLRGAVPESFVYRPKGKGGAVECVLRKRGGEGTLQVTMESDGRRSVQSTDARGGEIRVGVSGGGSTSSTTSSSSNSSSSSVVSQQSDSSVTVTQNNSSSGGD